MQVERVCTTTLIMTEEETEWLKTRMENATHWEYIDSATDSTERGMRQLFFTACGGEVYGNKAVTETNIEE